MTYLGTFLIAIVLFKHNAEYSIHEDRLKCQIWSCREESERIMHWTMCFSVMLAVINTLRPRQDGRRFPDDIFKCIFLNENLSISIKISLKFPRKGPINNIPALVQIMAWRRPSDKPLSEQMIRLPTHICVTRPQWVYSSVDTGEFTWLPKCLLINPEWYGKCVSSMH